MEETLRKDPGELHNLSRGDRLVDTAFRKPVSCTVGDCGTEPSRERYEGRPLGAKPSRSVNR